MRNRSVLYRLLTMAAAGLFIVGCNDGSPTKPSKPTPSQAVGIEVSGPDSIFTGQSAQFVATIQQADGTTKSATSMPGLRWRSSNPWVMSVSNSGLVTASGVQAGETVITAEFSTPGAAQGTRKVLVRPAVTAAVGITKQVTAGEISYGFAVTLTESASVSATISSLWITFDEGWGGQCGWTANQLGQKRLVANTTMTLDPLTCSDFGYEASSVEVSIELKNDNGQTLYVYDWRAPVIG